MLGSHVSRKILSTPLAKFRQLFGTLLSRFKYIQSKDFVNTLGEISSESSLLPNLSLSPNSPTVWDPSGQVKIFTQMICKHPWQNFARLFSLPNFTNFAKIVKIVMKISSNLPISPLPAFLDISTSSQSFFLLQKQNACTFRL